MPVNLPPLDVPSIGLGSIISSALATARQQQSSWEDFYRQRRAAKYQRENQLAYLEEADKLARMRSDADLARQWEMLEASGGIVPVTAATTRDIEKTTGSTPRQVAAPSRLGLPGQYYDPGEYADYKKLKALAAEENRPVEIPRGEGLPPIVTTARGAQFLTSQAGVGQLEAQLPADQEAVRGVYGGSPLYRRLTEPESTLGELVSESELRALAVDQARSDKMTELRAAEVAAIYTAAQNYMNGYLLQTGSGSRSQLAPPQAYYAAAVGLLGRDRALAWIEDQGMTLSPHDRAQIDVAARFRSREEISAELGVELPASFDVRLVPVKLVMEGAGPLDYGPRALNEEIATWVDNYEGNSDQRTQMANQVWNALVTASGGDRGEAQRKLDEWGWLTYTDYGVKSRQIENEGDFNTRIWSRMPNIDRWAFYQGLTNTLSPETIKVKAAYGGGLGASQIMAYLFGREISGMPLSSAEADELRETAALNRQRIQAQIAAEQWFAGVRSQTGAPGEITDEGLQTLVSEPSPSAQEELENIDRLDRFIRDRTTQRMGRGVPQSFLDWMYTATAESPDTAMAILDRMQEQFFSGYNTPDMALSTVEGLATSIESGQNELMPDGAPEFVSQLREMAKLLRQTLERANRGDKASAKAAEDIRQAIVDQFVGAWSVAREAYGRGVRDLEEVEEKKKSREPLWYGPAGLPAPVQ